MLRRLEARRRVFRLTCSGVPPLLIAPAFTFAFSHHFLMPSGLFEFVRGQSWIFGEAKDLVLPVLVNSLGGYLIKR